MDNPIDLTVVPDQVNLTKVADLLSLANISKDVPAADNKDDKDTGDDEDGPMTTRARADRQGIAFYGSARDTVKDIVKTYKKNFKTEKNFRVSVNTAINCVVQVLNDVIVKVNAQGGLKNETPDDSNTNVIRKLEEDLHNKIEERKVKLENEIKDRTDAL